MTLLLFSCIGNKIARKQWFVFSSKEQIVEEMERVRKYANLVYKE